MDSRSTINATIMNPDFVTNIKTSNKPLGMRTNAGMKNMNIEGNVPGFRRMWFDPD